MCAKLFDLDLLTPTCTGSYAARPTSLCKFGPLRASANASTPVRCTYNESSVDSSEPQDYRAPTIQYSVIMQGYQFLGRRLIMRESDCCSQPPASRDFGSRYDDLLS
jgi:hypothetical protein